MFEVINLKVDTKDEAVCICGNPENLTLCSGCKGMLYCSKDCQVPDWKKFHRKECNLFKMQQEQFI